MLWRGEPVDEPAERVMRLGVVAVLGREPDSGLLPLVTDVAGGQQQAVLDHVDRLVRLQRDRQRLAGLVRAERDKSWALRPSS